MDKQEAQAPALRPSIAFYKGAAANADDDEEDSSRAPPDRYKLAYLIFFLLGLGMLYPWNTFINANAYFGYRFFGTPFAQNFQNYFSIGFTLSNLTFLAIALNFQHKLTVSSRALFAMFLNLAVFLVATAMTKINDLEGTIFFYITLLLVILAGCSTALFQNSIFGLASEFPPLYTQAVMAGQGFSGLVISISQIAIIAASSSSKPPSDGQQLSIGPAVNATSSSVSSREVVSGAALTAQADAEPQKPDVDLDGAFAYFLVASLIIVTCIISYFVLKNLPLYDFHHTAPRRRRKMISENALAPESDPLLVGPDTSGHSQANDAASEDGDSSSAGTSNPRDGSGLLRKRLAATSGYNLFTVLAKIYPFALSVLFVFTVSLALFPATTSRILSTQPGANQDLFVAIHFLIFNAGDWIGRTLPGLGPIRRLFASCGDGMFSCCKPKAKRHGDGGKFAALEDEEQDVLRRDRDGTVANGVVDDGEVLVVDAADESAKAQSSSPSRFHPGVIGLLAIVRILFIPFFLLSNIVPSVIPQPLANDYAFMFVMLVFSMSNGLLGSLGMMAAPERVVGAEREVAGSMMVLFLTTGLASGSMLSFGLRAIVCGGCNPFLS